MAVTTKITSERFRRDVAALATEVSNRGYKYSSVYGIPRGGTYIAVALSMLLEIPLVDKEGITSTTLICDDLIDSGATIEPFIEKYDTAVLYLKPYSPAYTTYGVNVVNGWVEFFYEDTQVDIIANMQRILQFFQKTTLNIRIWAEDSGRTIHFTII